MAMRRNMETRTAVAAKPKEMALALGPAPAPAPLMAAVASSLATSAAAGSDAVAPEPAIPTHGLVDVCPANLLMYTTTTCLAVAGCCAACDGARLISDSEHLRVLGSWPGRRNAGIRGQLS
jgi:hypothetical protein